MLVLAVVSVRPAFAQSSGPWFEVNFMPAAVSAAPTGLDTSVGRIDFASGNGKSREELVVRQKAATRWGLSGGYLAENGLGVEFRHHTFNGDGSLSGNVSAGDSVFMFPDQPVDKQVLGFGYMERNPTEYEANASFSIRKTDLAGSFSLYPTDDETFCLRLVAGFSWVHAYSRAHLSYRQVMTMGETPRSSVLTRETNSIDTESSAELDAKGFVFGGDLRWSDVDNTRMFVVRGRQSFLRGTVDARGSFTQNMNIDILQDGKLLKNVPVDCNLEPNLCSTRNTSYDANIGVTEVEGEIQFHIAGPLWLGGGVNWTAFQRLPQPAEWTVRPKTAPFAGSFGDRTSSPQFLGAMFSFILK